MALFIKLICHTGECESLRTMKTSVVGISLLHTYKGSKLMESLFFGRGKRSIDVYVSTQ